MFKHFIALSFFSSVIAVTPVTRCKSGLPLPDQVDFNGCTQEICYVSNGGLIPMNVTFFARKTFEYIHMEAFLDNLGMETEYPIPEHDVCELFTNTQCPVMEGEMATFHTSIYFFDVPVNPIGLIFGLQEDMKDIYCFYIKAQIVNS